MFVRSFVRWCLFVAAAVGSVRRLVGSCDGWLVGWLALTVGWLLATAWLVLMTTGVADQEQR